MKLVCIDDVTDVLNFGNGEKHLTWGKEYEIVSFHKDYRGRQFVSIVNDRGKVYDYLLDRLDQGVAGSSPVYSTIMTYNATASTTDFDSVSLGSNPSRSTKLYMVTIAQLVRALDCGSRGCGIMPH